MKRSLSQVPYIVAGIIATTLLLRMLFPESFIPARYVCAVKSNDGCVIYIDKVRAKRYQEGKAGTK